MTSFEELAHRGDQTFHDLSSLIGKTIEVREAHPDFFLEAGYLLYLEVFGFLGVVCLSILAAILGQL